MRAIYFVFIIAFIALLGFNQYYLFDNNVDFTELFLMSLVFLMTVGFAFTVIGYSLQLRGKSDAKYHDYALACFGLLLLLILGYSCYYVSLYLIWLYIFIFVGSIIAIMIDDKRFKKKKY